MIVVHSLVVELVNIVEVTGLMAVVPIVLLLLLGILTVDSERIKVLVTIWVPNSSALPDVATTVGCSKSLLLKRVSPALLLLIVVVLVDVVLVVIVAVDNVDAGYDGP